MVYLHMMLSQTEGELIRNIYEAMKADPLPESLITEKCEMQNQIHAISWKSDNIPKVPGD